MSQEVQRILEADFVASTAELVRARRMYRHAAGIAESVGNVLLYVGIFLSTVASACMLVNTEQTAHGVLFASTACLAAHTALLGIARCSSREQAEREGLLRDVGARTGAEVVALTSPVTDDKDAAAPP